MKSIFNNRLANSSIKHKYTSLYLCRSNTYNFYLFIGVLKNYLNYNRSYVDSIIDLKNIFKYIQYFKFLSDLFAFCKKLITAWYLNFVFFYYINYFIYKVINIKF